MSRRRSLRNAVFWRNEQRDDVDPWRNGCCKHCDGDRARNRERRDSRDRDCRLHREYSVQSVHLTDWRCEHPQHSAGQSGTLALTLDRQGGFTGAVTVTAEGLPTGVTAAFNPTSFAAGVTSTTLTLNATSAATVGVTNVTVRASGTGVADKTVTVQLTITSSATPDFTLTAAPAALTSRARCQRTIRDHARADRWLCWQRDVHDVHASDRRHGNLHAESGAREHEHTRVHDNGRDTSGHLYDYGDRIATGQTAAR